MNGKSIKAHLAPYLILQKRKTTVNHAFASAIAPCAKYDLEKVEEAVRSLGQNPDDLKCVYCDGDASTWDHLIGLVAKGKFRGYGHQIGNLVPCCGPCNSEKGSKGWEIHLKSKSSEQGFEARRKVIADYAGRYAVTVDLEEAVKSRPDDWKRYTEIKGRILDLMKEADEVAANLRTAVLEHEKRRQDIAAKG